MAGKTNTKQICVFKTKKALLEFMDDTRYESEPMAWPHSPMSRLRINAKDYSKGTGDLAVDAFYNLSPEEFHRMQTAILKAKQLTINDFNRSNKHLERLMTLKKSSEQSGGTVTGLEAIEEIALQFKNSPNELFSEAGEQILAALSTVGATNVSSSLLDKMIAEANAELEEIKLSRELFSDIKILNYDKYINPENDKERRVTMFKVVFNPKMNYPFTFTVANGWGQPLITKQKGVMIKEGSVRFVDTVIISIDEKNLLPMLRRVEVFIQAMTTHGTAKYFETITNPVLYHGINDLDE